MGSFFSGSITKAKPFAANDIGAISLFLADLNTIDMWGLG